VPCPIQGIVYQSEQSVQTAIRLEKSRYRNASSTIPAGILRVTGGEPLTAEELGTLASQFNSARENNQTAAISQDVEYTPTTANPANMLLMEAANFQALEMTRITNIPPYLAGIDIGSYQYTTGKQSREDLYLFAARLYMQCIAETLSMNNVLPIGTYVDFDIDEFLSDLIETDYEESLVEEAPTMNQGGMNNA
jgi:phage portal protein BeeE